MGANRSFLHTVFRGSLLALVALATGACVYAKQSLSPTAVYANVIDSVASLKVETPEGERYVAAGFLYESDDLILTAWHVVYDAEQILVEFSDGASYKVTECVAYDKQADLALLQLETSTGREPAALSENLLSPGATIYSIGSPRGYAFSLADGMVSGLREIDGIEQLQVTCPFSPGNSGGPILNEFGEVIAVASWSNRNAQNLNFSIPVVYAERLRKVEVAAPISGYAATPVKASPRVEVSAEMTSDDYDLFMELLEEKSGQQVALSVETREGQRNFSFVAP